MKRSSEFTYMYLLLMDTYFSSGWILVPSKWEIIIVLSNYSFLQFSDSNIGLFSILKLSLSIFPALFLVISVLLSFILLSISNYRSSNYRASNICCSFLLLKAISFALLFAIVIKIKKSDIYRYHNSWKNDNYTEINTEKKPWTCF